MWQSVVKAVGFALNHFNDGLKLFAVLALMAALVEVLASAFERQVVIEHLGIPQSLQTQGYTENSVTTQLSAQLTRIVEEADSNRETNVSASGAALESELRDIELPETGLTLRWLILRLKQLFGRSHVSVRIDILCHDEHVAVDVLIDRDFGASVNYRHIHANTDVVAAHRPAGIRKIEEQGTQTANGKPGSGGKCHPDKGLDPALIKVAETITRWADPYILALYEYRKKNNEFVEIMADQMRVDVDPAQRPWFTNLQGLVRWRQGDTHAARVLFRRAQEKAGFFLGAAINEIGLELKEGNLDRGLLLLSNMEKRAFHPSRLGTVRKRRGIGEVYFLKAMVALQASDLLEAERLFEKAIWHHPHHWEATFNLGLVKEGLAQDPRKRERYLVGALDSFRRAAAIRPRNPEAWQRRMNLSFELGFVGEALRAYQVRLRHRGMNGLEHMKGGIAAFKLKRYHAAETSFLAARKLLVVDDFYCRWAIAVYDKLGADSEPQVQDQKAAIEVLRQCMDAASDEGIRKFAEDLVQRLQD